MSTPRSGQGGRTSSIIRWILSSIVAMVAILAISIFAARWMAAKPEDVPSWVQAVGAVVTIVSGAAFALWQQRHSANQKALDMIAAAEAAHSLAFEAFATIGNRLEVALAPQKPSTAYNLGGLRTTEMVDAMREVDTARIPTPLLADFIKLRSQIYAMNARITLLYAREDVINEMTALYARQRRRRKLASAVRTYGDAAAILQSFQIEANRTFGVPVKEAPLLAHIAMYNPDDDVS